MAAKKTLAKLFFLGLMGFALTPILVSFFTFMVFTKPSIERQTSNYADFIVDQFAEELSSNMKMLNNMAAYLMSEKRIRDIMSSTEPVTDREKNQMEQSISRAVLYNLAWDERYVHSIYLFREDDEYFGIFRENYSSFVLERMQEVYKRYREQSSTRTLFLDENAAYGYYVQDYYQIALQKQQKVGKLIIEVDVAKLMQGYNFESIYPQSAAFLSNLKGNIIFEANAEDALRDRLSVYPNDSSGFVSLEKGRKYYHSIEKLPRYDLKLDVFIPVDVVMEGYTSTINSYSWIQTLILSIAAVVCFWVLYRVRKYSKEALKRVERISTGDFSTEMMEGSHYRETELLAQTLNNLSAQLRDLFREVYEKGVQLSQAEYHRLEAQINPHFLFNVLETINMRCVEAGQMETSKMVTDLGRLLQSNITTKNKQKITYEEELRYATYYLSLQKGRFHGKLVYKIDIEEDELLSYYLPKLTLQPIIENSVVHGLENKLEGGMLQVSIWEEEDTIYTRIVDDGIGFDVSSLDLKSRKDPDIQRGRHHIALANVQRRIELLYGEGYGIQITSKAGIGTTVLITLPKDSVEE